MKKIELADNIMKRVLKCSLFEFCPGEKAVDYLKNIGAYACDFDAGEYIPAELRCRSYGIVISGSVRIFSNDNGGSSFLMNVVSECEVFDISSLTGNTERVPLSVIKTAGKCRIVFVPTCPIANLMKNYPEIAANCFRFFCGRIEFLNKKIRAISCGTSDRKLANFLLNEFCCENGKRIVRIKSCVELASKLNLSRASLYRAMDTLTESGIISHEYKLIMIKDLPRLQEII